MTGTAFFNDTSLRQLEITLPNGVRIIGLPANPLTARGHTGDVFLDEFAMHAADDAIWASLFPTLLRGDDDLNLASLPLGWCRPMGFQVIQSRVGVTVSFLVQKKIP